MHGPHSPESIRKMRESHRRNWGNEIFRAINSKLKRGDNNVARRPEVRRKISELATGRKLPKLSVQHRARLSQVAKLRPAMSLEIRQKISNTKTGRSVPVAVRDKMSRTWKLRLKDPQVRSARIKRLLKANLHFGNRPERKLLSILNSLGVGKFELNRRVIASKIPDIIGPDSLLVEMFGTYWHGLARTGRSRRKEENQRIRHFKAYGYRCVVVWSDELDDATVLRKLKRLL